MHTQVYINTLALPRRRFCSDGRCLGTWEAEALIIRGLKMWCCATEKNVETVKRCGFLLWNSCTVMEGVSSVRDYAETRQVASFLLLTSREFGEGVTAIS